MEINSSRLHTVRSSSDCASTTSSRRTCAECVKKRAKSHDAGSPMFPRRRLRRCGRKDIDEGDVRRRVDDNYGRQFSDRANAEIPFEGDARADARRWATRKPAPVFGQR